jgi:hypothetical protein
MPPVARFNRIIIKLFNCPMKAIPLGPTITDIIFTLINPVSIFTSVEIDVKEKTCTISAFRIRVKRCVSLLKGFSIN